MSDGKAKDWDPGVYQRFRGLRLRPALELLAQVRDLPPGPVVDMGCGAGAVAEALTSRYPDRELYGVDSSATMLAEAEATGFYDRLSRDDAADWTPGYAPALIFSNALAHWLPDHAALFTGWAGHLPAGGVLVVQMPRNFGEPSHTLLAHLAQDMFPDRFAQGDDWSPVASPIDYAEMLADLGDLRVWETTYIQHLPKAEVGHPVRNFTQSTGMRQYVGKMSETEAAHYTAAYDTLLDRHYPRRADGSVFFPFKRLFFVLSKNG